MNIIFTIKAFCCDTCFNYEIAPFGRKLILNDEKIQFKLEKLNLESGKCSQCNERYNLSKLVITHFLAYKFRKMDHFGLEI